MATVRQTLDNRYQVIYKGNVVFTFENSNDAELLSKNLNCNLLINN